MIAFCNGYNPAGFSVSRGGFPALGRTLRRPGDLPSATLLSVSHRADDWPHRFASAGLAPPTSKGLSFGSYAMALQAVPMGWAWYLVSWPARHREAGFTVFRDWLRAEVGCSSPDAEKKRPPERAPAA